MRVKLEEVCKRIYAGGDVPKDRYSEVKTEEYSVPIYANAEKDDGLYGYTDKARVEELSLTIAARGTIGFTAIRREPFLPVVRLITVVPDTDKVSERYLYYVLCNCKTQSSGTSIPQLTVPDIKKNSLELHSIAEQEYIADQLDKVNRIIELRQKELDVLDNLIKARFVEMFGDIKTNEYGWEKCTFKDVSTKITDGEHGTVPRVDEGEGYLYFMARNITKEGEIDLSETSFVPREIHEKIYKRCNPEKDDLLLVCVGATIGKCTLVSEIMGEFSMARSVALIKPNKEMVTSNFLINLLRSEAIQNDIDHCSHAAAQAGLYTNMINSLEAFVPPMDLQIEFDTFCEQVYKSKFEEAEISAHI